MASPPDPRIEELEQERDLEQLSTYMEAPGEVPVEGDEFPQERTSAAPAGLISLEDRGMTTNFPQNTPLPHGHITVANDSQPYRSLDQRAPFQPQVTIGEPDLRPSRIRQATGPVDLSFNLDGPLNFLADRGVPVPRRNPGADELYPLHDAPGFFPVVNAAQGGPVAHSRRLHAHTFGGQFSSLPHANQPSTPQYGNQAFPVSQILASPPPSFQPIQEAQNPPSDEIDRNFDLQGNLTEEARKLLEASPRKRELVEAILKARSSGLIVDNYWFAGRDGKQNLFEDWKKVFKHTGDNVGESLLRNSSYEVQFAYSTGRSRGELIAQTRANPGSRKLRLTKNNLDQTGAEGTDLDSLTSGTAEGNTTLQRYPTFGPQAGLGLTFDSPSPGGSTPSTNSCSSDDLEFDNDDGATEDADDEDEEEPINERERSLRRKRKRPSTDVAAQNTGGVASAILPRAAWRADHKRMGITFYCWPEGRILMWLCENEHLSYEGLPEVALGELWHPLWSVATPANVDIRILGNLEITAEEFFTFFPLHTVWRDPLYKYNRNGWSPTRIVEFIYYTRADSLTDTRAVLRNTIEKQVHKAITFVYGGDRWTKNNQRPADLGPLDVYNPGVYGDARGLNGANRELLGDYLLLDCAAGVSRYPEGLGAGGFTRALLYAMLNGNNPPLSGVEQYLIDNNLGTDMSKPDDGLNADLAAVERSRVAAHQHALDIKLPA